jgi:hypothetical protein
MSVFYFLGKVANYTQRIILPRCGTEAKLDARTWLQHTVITKAAIHFSVPMNENHIT